MDHLRISCPQGVPVSATWFAPQGNASRGVVVVAPALSTPRRFYAAFCEYLQQQGFGALCFDYRGIESGTAHEARVSDTDMETWLREDVSAAIDEARRRAHGAPVYLVGHSLGGMSFGATASALSVERALTVACGSGYPGLNPKSGRALWFLGNVAMPLYTRLFGFFPGKPIRKVGNLPRGVALQWSRWLKLRDYWFADPAYDMQARFDRVRCPLLALSFTDDAAIQRPAVDDLHRHYRNAPVQRAHLAPQALGLGRIGHMGFFRKDNGPTLWPRVVAWLNDGRNLFLPEAHDASH
jgi:predicted alpha/beta hydrolase